MNVYVLVFVYTHIYEISSFSEQKKDYFRGTVNQKIQIHQVGSKMYYQTDIKVCNTYKKTSTILTISMKTLKLKKYNCASDSSS